MLLRLLSVKVNLKSNEMEELLHFLIRREEYDHFGG